MPEYSYNAPIEGQPPAVPVLPMTGGWSDAQALKIVKTDFQMAETYRQQNVEPRWIQDDRTYLAWTGGGKVWDGTRIPRANAQIFLAFQQIQVMLPQVIDAIFGGDLTFDVSPNGPGTTLTQALAIRAYLTNQFQRLNVGNPNFISLRQIYRRMKLEDMIYGNGLCEFGWETRTDKRIRYERGEITTPQEIVYNGNVITLPGNRIDGVYSLDEAYNVSKPFLVPRTIKDFYIDPNCPSPNVQEARYCATRTLMPIIELQAMRGKEGFNIPGDEALFELSKRKVVTSGDTTKQIASSYQAYNATPWLDQSVDPRLARVEVIRYWQQTHHVWMLGREAIAFNGENKYGVLPFLGTFYSDVPNQFYAQSICDLVESDQNLAAELLNARLDELNLILHPPFIAKRGSFLATSAAKFRPGGKFELDNPKEDLIRMEMGNVTAEAFVEVDQIDRRTAKTIGVTDAVGFGISSAGGNSALRSATGVQTQANAQSSRIHGVVATDEDQFFLPLLNIFWGMNRRFMDPQQMIQIPGMDEPVDPVDMLNADPRFSMQTASKMKGRAALQGGGINQFFQGLLNPSIVEMAADQQNVTPDFTAIAELWCDAFNQKASTFFRPLTPQEIQQRQAKMLAPLQAKQQLQDSRQQSQAGIEEAKNETTLQATLMKVLAEVGALNELMGVKRDVEFKPPPKPPAKAKK